MDYKYNRADIRYQELRRPCLRTWFEKPPVITTKFGDKTLYAISLGITADSQEAEVAREICRKNEHIKFGTQKKGDRGKEMCYFIFILPPIGDNIDPRISAEQRERAAKEIIDDAWNDFIKGCDKEEVNINGKWTLRGYLIRKSEYYKLPGEADTEEQACREAKKKLKEFNEKRFSIGRKNSKNEVIPDRVYIVSPDGKRYPVLLDD